MVKSLEMKTTCAILAGGKSARLGQDKATTKIGKKNLIRFVYDVVKETFDDVIILSKIHGPIEGIDAPIFEDIVPYGNSMAGVVSALVYSQTPYTFVVACDMPFLSKTVLDYMLDEVTTGEDVIVPKTRWGYEPLHAIYNKSCISPFFRLIEQGRFKLREIFPFVSVKELEEHPCFFVNGTLVFTNINTAKDLDMVKAV
jgi:molybdopterin-guanine dinucleotide biosynthesis protein A